MIVSYLFRKAGSAIFLIIKNLNKNCFLTQLRKKSRSRVLYLMLVLADNNYNIISKTIIILIIILLIVTFSYQL